MRPFNKVKIDFKRVLDRDGWNTSSSTYKAVGLLQETPGSGNPDAEDPYVGSSKFFFSEGDYELMPVVGDGFSGSLGWYEVTGVRSLGVTRVAQWVVYGKKA